MATPTKFVGGIFLGHQGPKHRDIPDKNFMQVALRVLDREWPGCPGIWVGTSRIWKNFMQENLFLHTTDQEHKISPKRKFSAGRPCRHPCKNFGQALQILEKKQAFRHGHAARMSTKKLRSDFSFPTILTEMMADEFNFFEARN